MAFQPDAVAGAVRQSWHFVSGAEARIGNHFARGCVDRFARSARVGGGQGGVLRLAFEVPNLRLAFRWFAEDSGARDVRLIAFHAASVVYQYHVAFAKLLRL